MPYTGKIILTIKNLNHEILKKNYGKYLIFWGGCCDTRNILPKASTEKVMEHVRENIKILGKDGGLVFNQIHNIQPEVPPSNIFALFKAVNLYGKY